MKARDLARIGQLDAQLDIHHTTARALPGVVDPAARSTLLDQLVDSIHRVQFPRAIAARPISPERTNPANTALFDPVRAAIYHARARGDLDEAAWLVFLFAQFGKHARSGYALTRNVYGALGGSRPWDWAAVSTNIGAFLQWLHTNHAAIKPSGVGFGNHRKFESLKVDITGRTILSYVDWVAAEGSHRARFDAALAQASNDPQVAFDVLYRSMDTVHRFGRLARFDYLTMIGKLELAAIAPGRTYLIEQSGPVNGARLLFGVDRRTTPAMLEEWLIALDVDLDVGAQVLEDALCNWQKSPTRYVRFFG